MKKTSAILFLITSVLFSLTTFASAEHNHGQHQHDSMSEKKAAMGTGVIHSVSRMNRKVNLTHEPIPELNWPEMKMDLDVAKDVNLKGLSSGQKIQFHIELGEDKVYRITEIMKEGHNKMGEKQHGHKDH
jgi:Cu/Ag efflux protein CusF